MPLTRRLAAGLLAVGLCAAALAPLALAADPAGGPREAGSPATAPVIAAVDHAAVIAGLDSDDPAARRAASLRLGGLGGDALPVVERALANNEASPEAAVRLRRALPLLKARARREGRERERDLYISAAVEAAYRSATGGTDPSYDADALDVIRRWRKTPDLRAAADRQSLLDGFRRVAERGCRNQCFLLAYVSLVGHDWHLAPREFDVGNGIVWWHTTGHKSAPPAIRVMMAGRAAQYIPQSMSTADANAAAALTALIADPAAPPGLADDLAAAYVSAVLDPRTPWRNAKPEAFLAAYDKVGPGRPGYHLFQGNRLVDAAWEARGGGYANTVTPEGWKLFHERLGKARKELEEAHRLDPADARPPALLITVHMGLGSDRAAMEACYRQAMTADPDNREAPHRKLYYLYPRWYGSHEEMIAFGRECLATQNWRAGIPFVLMDAHRAVAAETAAGDPNAYYAAPDVWRDVRAVYDGHLVNAPDDVVRRSEFARLATQAGEWGEADAQFRLLGENVDYRPFGGRETFAYLKRKAARLAGAAPATVPAAPATVPAAPAGR